MKSPIIFLGFVLTTSAIPINFLDAREGPQSPTLKSNTGPPPPDFHSKIPVKNKAEAKDVKPLTAPSTNFDPKNPSKQIGQGVPGIHLHRGDIATSSMPVNRIPVEKLPANSGHFPIAKQKFQANVEMRSEQGTRWEDNALKPSSRERPVVKKNYPKPPSPPPHSAHYPQGPSSPPHGYHGHLPGNNKAFHAPPPQHLSKSFSNDLQNHHKNHKRDYYSPSPPQFAKDHNKHYLSSPYPSYKKPSHPPPPPPKNYNKYYSPSYSPPERTKEDKAKDIQAAADAKGIDFHTEALHEAAPVAVNAYRNGKGFHEEAVHEWNGAHARHSYGG